MRREREEKGASLLSCSQGDKKEDIMKKPWSPLKIISVKCTCGLLWTSEKERNLVREIGEIPLIKKKSCCGLGEKGGEGGSGIGVGGWMG